MSHFEQQRHKPPTALDRPRELIVVCSPLRSNVNLSRIVRAAGCCGVTRVVACGAARVIHKIARDGGDDEDGASGVAVEIRRTLAPLLASLRREGYALVGLEQASGSTRLCDFEFPRRTALVVGNERRGIDQESLDQLDAVVEIPVYGRPLAHNAATAAAIAMYEYCRQYPLG